MQMYVPSISIHYLAEQLHSAAIFWQGSPIVFKSLEVRPVLFGLIESLIM